MTEREGNIFADAILRSMIWAFVGLIFGTILTVFSDLIGSLHLAVPTVIPATAMAAIVGVLFYGSMELAVLASIASLIASFGFIMLSPGPNGPLSVAIVAVLSGVIVGAFYGRQSHDEHVKRTSTKFLTGLISGIVAAGFYLTLKHFVGPMPLYWEAGLLCAMTGGIYVNLLPLLGKHLGHNLPATFNGILAGGCVAGFFGICVWLATGDLVTQISGAAAQAADRVLADLLPAAGGAAVGAAIGGFLGGLLGLDWEDV